MCGGRGSRLDVDAEKPLHEIDGRPMVDRVLTALEASGVETVHAVVSPQAPATRDHLAGTCPLVETPGEGYVADLGAAVDRVGTPVLTVAADLPLLAGDAVDDVLAAADGSRTVVVPAALKRALGVAVDYDRAWVPAGVNVAGDGDGSDDTAVRSWDARLAVNVNRATDADAARKLLTDGP
ncbi:MAG: NTP transferase domain-containing protein [Halolamina sp.]